RYRRRRVRRGHSVASRPWLFRQADRAWMGPGPHRPRLGRADGAARLQEIRRPGRRLGQRGHRADGAAAARRPDWRAHQHAGDGAEEGLTRDDVLDNVTLYWLTNTAVSSARLYWESKLAFFAPKGVTLPMGVSAYPDEIYTAPESWARRAYPNLVHYGRLAKGG